MELLFDSNFEPGQTLCEEESRHCIKVLRHKVGDTIHITNGNGTLYTCKLIDANPRGCVAEIEKAETAPAPKVYLHIAVAPTKNTDRLEWFVEKAVEMGISEISPIICKRSERTALRIDRLQRIAVSACKQSLKYSLPIINEPMTFEQLVERTSEEQRFILHCLNTPKPHLFEAAKAKLSTIVLIGPEGDFAPEEIEKAHRKGFVECTLGEERLRTETAAMVATHTIDLLNQITK